MLWLYVKHGLSTVMWLVTNVIGATQEDAGKIGRYLNYKMSLMATDRTRNLACQNENDPNYFPDALTLAADPWPWKVNQIGEHHYQSVPQIWDQFRKHIYIIRCTPFIRKLNNWKAWNLTKILYFDKKGTIMFPKFSRHTNSIAWDIYLF